MIQLHFFYQIENQNIIQYTTKDLPKVNYQQMQFLTTKHGNILLNQTI